MTANSDEMVIAADGPSPYLRGGYAPVEREISGAGTVIEGEVPRDLAGVYVRNGPNPRFSPLGRYHWFDGDGMLHAVRIEDGRVHYLNRWVTTAHLAEEKAAGRALWRGIMEPTRDNPRHAPYKDTANTDVLAFGDRLLALWYIGGEPYLIDPRTLATVGAAPWRARAGTRVAAHAKVDPVSGELFFFDFGPVPPFMTYGVVDALGERVQTVPIDLPGPRLPHDMAITERYAVLMDLPVLFDPAAMKQKRWVTYFDRGQPARFGVLPRGGTGATGGAGSQIRWFEAEPCYVYHSINAWEEGDEIVLVGCRVADPVPAVDPRDGPWGRMMANLRVEASLHRWRFNLTDGSTREERLDDRNTEFPSMDRRRLGRPTRFAYHVSLSPDRTLKFDGIVKYDTATGAAERYGFGTGRFGSEAPFAPRVGADGEDDGYVLSFVQDEREGVSELLILDARQISAGPVARVRLPQRVPYGFHACFVPAAGPGSGETEAE